MSRPGYSYPGFDGPTRARVKALLLEGACNKIMARRIGVSVGTVKAHLERIYRDTGTRNRVQAAVAIVRQEIGR